MNPLKHKMANEWMRQEDATPEEALDTWNTMEAEFKANRAMSQEPRTMVADASTEMEQFPDSYLRPKRYDILTGLDVPAETLEDWDVSFRNPNAQGGRIGLQGGQLVEPGIGRPGYGGPGSGAKKGSIPRQSSATKRATRYKKILENLPEGYFDEYVKNFYNVDKKTEKLTHVGGGLNPEKGIPYMEKKYGNILKETLTSMPDLEIKDVNAAVKKSIEDQIESGLNRGERLRKIDLKAIGDWYPKAPKGMVTHHFLPKAGMEGTDLNYASSRNTAFISKELNGKMSPIDKKLKANQKEQIKLLKEKKSGWEKKIEDLNTRSRALVKNAAKEIPGSAGYLGFSEMKITSEGKPIFETRGIDYNKSLSGINEADTVIYKNISDADKIIVNKMSNIKNINIKNIQLSNTPESRLKGKKVMVASTLDKFLKSKGEDICG